MLNDLANGFELALNRTCQINSVCFLSVRSVLSGSLLPASRSRPLVHQGREQQEPPAGLPGQSPSTTSRLPSLSHGPFQLRLIGVCQVNSLSNGDRSRNINTLHNEVRNRHLCSAYHIFFVYNYLQECCFKTSSCGGIMWSIYLDEIRTYGAFTCT